MASKKKKKKSSEANLSEQLKIQKKGLDKLLEAIERNDDIPYSNPKK